MINEKDRGPKAPPKGIIAQNDEGGKKCRKNNEIGHQINPEPENFCIALKALHNKLSSGSRCFNPRDFRGRHHIFRVIIKRSQDNTNDYANETYDSKPDNVPDHGKP